MSARRQPSTTSLSKFARANSPVLQNNRSLDFCNSFWGHGDGGVDVLFARMRGAARTMEELRMFWKERAAIEEDYAKRLAKLSKMILGRDEIGELRNSLDTVKIETERQSGFHLNVAHQIRADLEAPTATFNARQVQHKKTLQNTIEKEFKNKQIQESYVNKAREKYEQDCLRINSFTAQASLVQGKDLEKINLKLERTQQTVQTNEREFASYSKALHETVQKWEQDWKGFCDSCQDMEESRLEFMKDNMWLYANTISTACVSDDESCEKIRVALELMEPEKDMESFVIEYGTGNEIPDPPHFVNYQAADAIPSASARPTSRPAHFRRETSREIPLRQNTMPQEPEPIINAAGVGAGGGQGKKRADSYASDVSDNLSRQPTRNAIAPAVSTQQAVPYTNGHAKAAYHTSISPSAASSSSSSQPTARRQSVGSSLQQQQQLQNVLRDPYAEPIDPSAETYIKVGNNAYKVDLSKDPQQQGSSSSTTRFNTVSPTKVEQKPKAAPSWDSGLGQNGAVDPLMKQLEDLKNAVSSSGSVRRSATTSRSKAGTSPEPKPGHASTPPAARPTNGGAPSLLPPAAAPDAASSARNRSPSPGRDYRNSAEFVVGAHPSVSRPTSPAPPTAVFMQPKPGPAGPEGEVVQEVLADYQQSLPGERKAISRSNSATRGHAASNSQASVGAGVGGAQNLARPPSQMGHAGIGAHGSRSNSPQPISRGPSPAPTQPRANFIQPPAQIGQNMARTPSPNTVGIALDPSGRVLHDDLAQRYQQQQQQQQQQHRPPMQQAQQPSYQAPSPAQALVQTQQQQQQRRGSFVAPAAPPPMMAPPVVPQPYGVSPPPAMYQQTPSPQPSYVHPPPVQAVYNPPPPAQYQAPPPQQLQQQPTQMGYGSVSSVNGLQRAGSMLYYENHTPPQQHQIQPVHQLQPQQQQPVQQRQMLSVQTQPQQQQPQQQQVRGYQQQPQQQQQQQQTAYNYRGPSPAREPSPQPPQATDDGNTVLFYVKALYDYAATIEEEFDFQAGDIIAVTATPEDGWWSGELLDENRRQKGRNVFPSNFVCLF
ncbi:hypothetical protein HYPSUDRAFT_621926 [Hypholoma sublateritium FD-334 SS-4]|uniref:SH3 domain-containing protein n=1 Tax=Hypholoma sublateritium (strain FD-334 SS-4) TaxID=945553 RepID=A0A0D2PDB0_HYPSF|nr:hypothetical protein HYPSUDRAFT_621926 [Hypholoma sublateritium FD-334 SS-4]